MTQNKFHLIDGVVHENYFDVNGSAPAEIMNDLSPAQLHALANDGSGVEIGYEDGAIVVKCWRDTFDDYARYEIPFWKFMQTLDIDGEPRPMYPWAGLVSAEVVRKQNEQAVPQFEPERKYPIKPSHHTDTGYDGLESVKQSPAPRRFDLLPWNAIRAVAELQSFAVKKYGFETWKNVPLRDHYNHAIAHVIDAFIEDTSEETIEDSITHAINRLMFIREELHDRA